MQIVIEIPDEKYQWIKEHRGRTDYQITEMIYKRVRKGTPLPKGHGRLIDADDLAHEAEHCLETTDAFIELIQDAPTIIKADKAESEDIE